MVGCPTFILLHCFINSENVRILSPLSIFLMQLQDYSRNPSTESEVKFNLSKVTLEPLFNHMVNIRDQLSAPTRKFAVLNLKVCDFVPLELTFSNRPCPYVLLLLLLEKQVLMLLYIFILNFLEELLFLPSGCKWE